jgi:murein DD-endopeptidase MepM/ murein hydrolase activator NlpD
VTRLPQRLVVTCSAFAAVLAAPAIAGAATTDPKLRPVVDAITCRNICQAIDAGATGSVTQISGQNLGAVNRVILLGRRGKRDDKLVAAVPVSATATLITLPAGARTGPVRAITSAGVPSAASSRRLMIGRAGAGPRRGALLQARADVRRVVDGVTPSVSFYVRSSKPQDVAIDVLRNGQPVAHWDVPGVPGRAVHSIAWIATGQPEGRYTWRVWPKAQADANAAMAPSRAGGGAAAPTTATAASSVAGPPFYVVRHVFPIVGAHSYGMSAGRFGAGRGGRSHQGQDVFAKCGTPLVAVTSGTIKFNGQQSLAGNYIVLDADDGSDYAYMHMRAPSPLKKGAVVTAGQLVGNVGDTGDAQGCHLHFEVWPAPGWYDGGSPVDPLPILKSWDA